MKLRLASVILLSLAVVAAACNDDNGGNGSENGDDNGGDGNGNGAITVTRFTGNEPLDYTLSATAVRDIYEMAALTLYHHVDCSPSPEGDAPPPQCRAGEDEGDEVEVFHLIACDETWVRPEALPGKLDELVNHETLDLVSVYEPTDQLPDDNDTDYVAVFQTTPESEPQAQGIGIYVKEARLYAIECAGDITRLVTADRVENQIFSP